MRLYDTSKFFSTFLSQKMQHAQLVGIFIYSGQAGLRGVGANIAKLQIAFDFRQMAEMRVKRG